MFAPANGAWVCYLCLLCCVVAFTLTEKSKLVGLEDFLLSTVNAVTLLDGALPLSILDMLFCWSWEATALLSRLFGFLWPCDP